MKTKTNAFTLIELLVVLAILGILAALCVGGIGGCTRSKAANVGTVSSFGIKGMSVATESYEGELIMGGTRIKTGDNGSIAAVANVWAFSVLDIRVAKQIEALRDNGHRAKLSYEQTVAYNPLKRSTRFIVVEATDLDSTNAPTTLER